MKKYESPVVEVICMNLDTVRMVGRLTVGEGDDIKNDTIEGTTVQGAKGQPSDFDY